LGTKKDTWQLKRMNNSYLRLNWSNIFLLVVFMALTVLPGWAADGDGTGGGKGEPLSIVSSNPYDGQKDVALPLLITMTFSKNVVNMTVIDNNLKCFSLYTTAGTMIPIDVIMADDQIEPENKNDVSLKPLQELKHDTAYTVKVSSALKSKSGVTLADDLTITFTTVKGTAAAESPLSGIAVPQNMADSPPASVITEAPAGAAEPQAAQINKGDQSGVGTGGAAVPGSSLAASSGDNTKVAGADNRAGESSGQRNASESDQPGGGQGAGTGTWAFIIAGLALLVAVGYFISRKKK
jgi:LPXTG-motif cell wall-anchored protein